VIRHRMGTLVNRSFSPWRFISSTMFYIPLVIVHNSFMRFIIVDCSVYTIDSVALLIYRLNTNVPSPTLLLVSKWRCMKRERETYTLGVHFLRKYTLVYKHVRVQYADKLTRCYLKRGDQPLDQVVFRAQVGNRKPLHHLAVLQCAEESQLNRHGQVFYICSGN